MYHISIDSLLPEITLCCYLHVYYFFAGILLSSFYYGYLFTQIPGGWLAYKYGGKRVFGLSLLITSVLTLITPVVTRKSIYLLIAVRILRGLAEVN